MKRELSLDELRVVMRKYLEAHDLKETYTRNIVLEYVYQLEKPFDADSVYKKLREAEGKQISRSTVYSAIDLLCRCGILIHLTRNLGANYILAWRCRGYALVLCSECGKLNLFRQENLSKQMQYVKPPRFSPTQAVMVVFGECKECTNRNQTESSDGAQRKDKNTVKKTSLREKRRQTKLKNKIPIG
jgi:putative ferric uptake transcriptional regulator